MTAASPNEPALCDGIYTVFAVDAADRFTLVKVVDGEPEFRQAMLAFVVAPKVARRQPDGSMGEDDACAYDAMEFVRSLVIGRQVRFVDLWYVAPLKRFAGAMSLSDGTEVAAELLKAGLATIPSRLPKNMDKDLHTDYLALQTIARNNRVGVHAPDANERVRLVIPHPPEDWEGFASAIEGTTMRVRVDRVATGTGLLLHVANPDDELEFQAVQAVLTGAQANPTLDRLGGRDSLGLAAKLHTERLLLHRAPNVRFEGLDPNGNFLVTITSASKGTFQEELLAKGFARINPNTIDRAENPEALRAAEKKAREAELGIWSRSAGTDENGTASGAAAAEPGVVPVVTSAPRTAEGVAAQASGADAAKPAVQYKGDASFEGTVVQVVNGDTMVVRNSKTKEYVRVSLAGVKAPKITNRDGGEQRGGPRPPVSAAAHEKYTWESREFLRTTCIGQRVRVMVEYARVMDQDSKEVRGMATVVDIDSGVNIGAALLRQGLATFFLGRNDVCSRADELRAAEAEAAEKGLNIHNTRVDAPTTMIKELNRISEKDARYHLAFLQRGMQGKKPPVLRAVVEMVLSGSSFRVYVPREHTQFSLKLAGIVTPSNVNGQSDPFADESRDFAVTSLQQREVEIMVEAVDRGGNFLGYLLHRGKNFGQAILEEGLATCSNADRTLYPHEYSAAEKKAKEAKKNIWSDQGAVPAMAAKRAAQAAARVTQRLTYQKAEGAQEWRPMYVTNVDDAAGVHVNWATGDVDASRDAMAPLIEAIGADSEAKRHSSPTKGEIVVAFFKEDKTWYRGKVQDVFADEKRASVLFIDFGNVVECSFKDIRAVPKDNDEYEILRTTAPLAVAIRLAYVLNRGDNQDYADAAVAVAWEFVGDVTELLYAKLAYSSDNGNTKYYIVASQPDGPTLQTRLLREGAAYVNRDAAPVDPAAVSALLNDQQVARRDHIGIWIHGDFEDDEE